MIKWDPEFAHQLGRLLHTKLQEFMTEQQRKIIAKQTLIDQGVANVTADIVNEYLPAADKIENEENKPVPMEE